MPAPSLAQDLSLIRKRSMGAAVATCFMSVMFFFLFPQDNYYLVNGIFIVGFLLPLLWLRLGWIAMAHIQLLLTPALGILWGEAAIGPEAHFHFCYIPLICDTVLTLASFSTGVIAMGLSIPLLMACIGYVFPISAWMGYTPMLSLATRQTVQLVTWIICLTMTFFFALSYMTEIKKRMKLLAEAQAAEALQSQQLARANALVEMLLHAVSHDLAAPVAQINSVSELIKREHDVIKIQEYAAMQQDTAQHLHAMIHELVESPRRARHELNIAPIQWESLIATVRQQIPSYTDDIALSHTISGTGVLYSDAYFIGIVLRNLLANAIRYRDTSKPQTSISIEVQSMPTEASVSLSDNGRGISADALPFVFDKFFQADSLSQGSGLGLYLAKECVSLLQGSISVHSEEAKYTTFIVRLPNLRHG